jgi:periplasmic divalent cation tolerance protein
MDSVVVVLSTFPSVEVAATVARTLVEERLAACVNVVAPVQSIYRWEGAIHDAAEVLAIIKTTAARVVAMRDRLVELHPYDVPEAIELPVAGGHTPYLAWVTGEVTND